MRTKTPELLAQRTISAWIVLWLAVLALAGCYSTVPVRHAEPRARPQPAAPVPPRVAYELGPGDVLEISVYNNSDLDTKTAIGEDGKISFPLIGEVALAGLTRGQAEQRIAHRLEAGGFVRKPYVNILIAEYRSQTISVLGEVNKPGAYEIRRPLNVTQVLAMAGGITDKGSSVVTLVQKDRDGIPHREQIDLNRLLDQGNLGKDALVGNGDIVFVPQAPVFYIYGEVRNPGSYPLKDGMTVQQALSLGGGLTVRGTQNGITVDRTGPDGRMRHYRARMSSRLMPGDVVHVPQSWF